MVQDSNDSVGTHETGKKRTSEEIAVLLPARSGILSAVSRRTPTSPVA